jgi:hypothetical protein
VTGRQIILLLNDIEKGVSIFAKGHRIIHKKMARSIENEDGERRGWGDKEIE